MPSAFFHDAGGIAVIRGGKREYETYILIDFAESTDEVPNLFTDVPNLGFIFMSLKYLPICCCIANHRQTTGVLPFAATRFINYCKLKKQLFSLFFYSPDTQLVVNIPATSWCQNWALKFNNIFLLIRFCHLSAKV